MPRTISKAAREHLLRLLAKQLAPKLPAAEGLLTGTGWSGTFGGLCPVQGHGRVDGMAFYFRARGAEWSLEVATAGGDPVDVCFGETEGFYYSEPYSAWLDAGYMPAPQVLEAMERAVAAFRAANFSRASAPAGAPSR